MIITKHSELKDICSKLEQEKIIAIDTEFYRHDTYYPKLSLIQIGTPRSIYVVDALSVPDLQLLKTVFNSDRKKIFHDCIQDVQIISNYLNIKLDNIFDIQLGAFMTEGVKMSYRHICSSFMNVNIVKDCQDSNWLKRPLSAAQIKYAMNDVKYMIDIYKKISDKVLKSHLKSVYDKKIYEILENIYKDPRDEAWKKIKNLDMTSENFNAIKKIAFWREETAMKIDLPKKWIMSDEDIIRISNSRPKDITQLKRTVRVSPHLYANLDALEEVLGIFRS